MTGGMMEFSNISEADGAAVLFCMSVKNACISVNGTCVSGENDMQEIYRRDEEMKEKLQKQHIR